MGIYLDTHPGSQMHVIAVASQKGGVGKTTTAVHVAAGLALQGHRTLLVDLDQQHNASSWLGVDGGRLLYEWLATLGKGAFDEAIQATQIERLSMVASSKWIVGIDSTLTDALVPQTILRKGLAQIAYDCDYAILDCAPGLSLLTVNALAAADSLLIPAAAHVMSLAGLAQLHETAEEVREELNPRLGAERVLATRVDARNNHSKDVQDELRKRLGRNLLSTYARENVRVAESFGHAQTVYDYAPRSAGAEDYYSISAEVAEVFTNTQKR